MAICSEETVDSATRYYYHIQTVNTEVQDCCKILMDL